MASAGNSPTGQPAEPPARTRWHSAPWWVGVSGVFTIVGVIVAVVTLMYTAPGGDATTGTPTGAASIPQQPTAAASGPGRTSPATAPGYLDPVTEELKLAAASVGTSSWLDVDQPRVFQTPSYTAEVKANTQADLQYTDDGEFSTLFTHEFARVGYMPAGIVTLEQCLAKVELQALGQHEKPEVDRNICVVTAQGTVAWIRVVQLTEPRLYDHPSLLVRATIWKRATPAA